MRRAIELLINKLYKPDLELLFGRGSRVIVNYCRYSTNNLSFVIDCKVLVSDIELSKDVYPDGLVLLVKDSWRFIGLDEKISVICSIDIT
jgi:hypothetical protein